MKDAMEASRICGHRALCALHLIECKKRNLCFSSKHLPAINKALLSLKISAQECKTVIDRYGLEYDSSSVFRFLKEAFETLLLKKDSINEASILKYLYFKEKLKKILQWDFLVDYIIFIQPRLESCSSASETETFVRKFLKVYHLTFLRVTVTQDEVGPYEFMSSLLEFCFSRDVQDSRLIVDLLKAVIDCFAVGTRDVRCVRHQCYSQGFFEFILRHSNVAQFDLEYYSRNNPLSLWLYLRNFSVATAVGFGNVPRTKTLLQHGFHVISDAELRRSGHGHPYLREIMPESHLMVLCMMCSMMSINRVISATANVADIELYSMTEDQKECFRLIWRAIPDSYVRQKDMTASIVNEHSALTRLLVFDSDRNEKNFKLSLMYEAHFPDLAQGTKEPRSLQHLCRCAIRKRLQEKWLLPSGIFQLRLPNLLKKYINLEE